LDGRWATLGDRRIDILLPRINKLQHSYLIDYIKYAEIAKNDIRVERESVSEALEDAIDNLIKEYKKSKNKEWWHFWK